MYNVHDCIDWISLELCIVAKAVFKWMVWTVVLWIHENCFYFAFLSAPFMYKTIYSKTDAMKIGCQFITLVSHFSRRKIVLCWNILSKSVHLYLIIELDFCVWLQKGHYRTFRLSIHFTSAIIMIKVWVAFPVKYKTLYIVEENGKTMNYWNVVTRRGRVSNTIAIIFEFNFFITFDILFRYI